jgi:hypothetical protein
MGGYRDAPEETVESFRTPIPWTKIGIVAAIVAIMTLGLWLIFRTRIVDVKVSAVHWSHAVKIDRWQIWHRDGWYPDRSAFNIHDEGPRIHHYDHVLVGHHTESVTSSSQCGEDCTTVRGACRTTPVSCSSNKNGSATCTGGDRECDPDTRSCSPRTCNVSVPDYEDQPRYQDYYDWNVWDWGYNRTVTHSGADLSESWPSDNELQPFHLNDGEREREAGRVAEHRIVFTNGRGDETWNLTPSTCDEFQRYPVGAHHRIKVGLAHGVEVLR